MTPQMELVTFLSRMAGKWNNRKGSAVLRKHIFSFSLCLVLLFLTSCRSLTSISPEGSGDIDAVSPPLPSIYNQTPSMSIEASSPPSPAISTAPSPTEDQIEKKKAFVRTGFYLDPFPFEEGEGRSVEKYTDWYDAFYWPLEAEAFSNNGIVIGEFNEFAEIFKFSIKPINDTSYSLTNSEGNELILVANSDVAIFNGKNIMLETSTIYSGFLFIPLRSVAELMGLYTYQHYSNEYDIEYLWISECSVLDKKEFLPDDNFALVDTVTEPGYTGGFFTYSDYNLKEEGSTFSGVRIGDSFDETISLLGSPQEHVFYELDINPDLEKCYISYTLFPESMNDYADYISYFFENNVLIRVLLHDVESITQS